ncbi:hypothetical protein [Mycoplasma hafezii]|uniref:hypothetical protein n=1 Tax=Mycoplasma hafezii TaxID=525886 RepID=UPI003CF7159F
MKVSELQKLSNVQEEKIEVGFGILALITSLGALANAIAPLVGLVKVALAPQGEIKDKVVGYKWQMGKDTPKTSLESFTTFE